MNSFRWRHIQQKRRHERQILSLQWEHNKWPPPLWHFRQKFVPKPKLSKDDSLDASRFMFSIILLFFKMEITSTLYSFLISTSTSSNLPISASSLNNMVNTSLYLVFSMLKQSWVFLSFLWKINSHLGHSYSLSGHSSLCLSIKSLVHSKTLHPLHLTFILVHSVS